MGKQSRIRAERREAHKTMGRSTQLLREFHDQIRSLTYAGSRRSWELMIEIMADLTGVNILFNGTLTDDSHKVLHDLRNPEFLLKEFLETFNRELQICRDAGSAVPDPIGEVLEQSGGTNEALGQFFTPASVVRMMNQLTMQDTDQECRVLDPACGTGRFALDVVVHHPRAVTFNVDLDKWLHRAALVSFRYAQEFTYARIKKPLMPTTVFEAQAGSDGDDGTVVILGGRTWILNADSLIVDLECHDNWKYSWMWDQPPWQEVMKVADFDGTYNEWIAQRGTREIDKKLRLAAEKKMEPRFDLKLDDDELRRVAVKASRGERNIR